MTVFANIQKGRYMDSLETLFAASLLGKREPLRERLSRRPVLLCACLTLGVIVILLFGSYGIGYDAGDFIYGQF